MVVDPDIRRYKIGKEKWFFVSHRISSRVGVDRANLRGLKFGYIRTSTTVDYDGILVCSFISRFRRKKTRGIRLMDPKVSIIVPCFNEQCTIGMLLEAILNQRR